MVHISMVHISMVHISMVHISMVHISMVHISMVHMYIYQDNILVCMYQCTCVKNVLAVNWPHGCLCNQILGRFSQRMCSAKLARSTEQNFFPRLTQNAIA
jgi:hypothetical protein